MWIVANQLAIETASIAEGNGNSAGTPDHVAIGDQETVRCKENARRRSLHFIALMIAAPEIPPHPNLYHCRPNFFHGLHHNLRIGIEGLVLAMVNGRRFPAGICRDFLAIDELQPLIVVV